MKKTTLIIVLTICLILLILSSPTSQHTLRTGTITFEKVTATNQAFSIKTHIMIPPNSRILFTDSEWNGTRFGIDEHTMIWNTGKDSIFTGSTIRFENVNSHAIASKGHVHGVLKIAYRKDAIFAYQGTKRMPTHFIAGVAYRSLDYGTLENTGLRIGNTALILP